MSGDSTFDAVTEIVPVAVDQTDPNGTAARHKALQRIRRAGVEENLAASTEKILWEAAMGDPPELTGIGWMQYNLLMNALGPTPERMPTKAQRAAMANQFLGGNPELEERCRGGNMKTYAERLRKACLDSHLQMLGGGGGGGGAAEEGERAPKRQRPSPAYKLIESTGKGGSHNALKVRNEATGQIVVLRVPTIRGVDSAHTPREKTVRTLWETWGGTGPKSEALRAVLPPYFEPYTEVNVDGNPKINYAMPVALGTDSMKKWKKMDQAGRWASAKALGESLVAAFEAGYVMTDAKPRNFVWYANSPDSAEGCYRVCDIDALASFDDILEGAIEMGVKQKTPENYAKTGPSLYSTYTASAGAGTKEGPLKFWTAIARRFGSDHCAAAQALLHVVQYDSLWAIGLTVLLLAADNEAHQKTIMGSAFPATLWSHKSPTTFEGCGDRLRLLSALSSEAYYGTNTDLPKWFQTTFIDRLTKILNDEVPEEIKRPNTFAPFA